MAQTKWITTSEAADMMEVSVSTIRRLIENEDLVARRRTRDGPYLISVASIEEYIDSIDSGERKSPDFQEGFDRGFNEGFEEAEAEADLEDEEDEDDEDDEDLDDDDDDRDD